MAPDLQPAVERYRAAPTPAHRDAVVRAGAPLVRALVGRLHLPRNPLASPEDLESTAFLALLQALETYDPDRGTQFVTHAYRRIQGALIDELRSLDVLSAERRKKLAQLNRTAEALSQSLGREPTDDELADRLEVDLDDVYARQSDAQLRFALSLSAAAVSDDDDGAALSDLLEDEDGQAGFEAVERDQLVETLQREIAALPERQQAILGLHYLEGLTLKEVGRVLGVSDARVCQILGQTNLTLRRRLTAVVAPARQAA